MGLGPMVMLGLGLLGLSGATMALVGEVEWLGLASILAASLVCGVALLGRLTGPAPRVAVQVVRSHQPRPVRRGESPWR